MLDLLLQLIVVVCLVSVSYKIGRKKKKVELDTLGLIILGSVFSVVFMYIFINFESIFSKNGTPVTVTEFDY